MTLLNIDNKYIKFKAILHWEDRRVKPRQTIPDQAGMKYHTNIYIGYNRSKYKVSNFWSQSGRRRIFSKYRNGLVVQGKNNGSTVTRRQQKFSSPVRHHGRGE